MKLIRRRRFDRRFFYSHTAGGALWIVYSQISYPNPWQKKCGPKKLAGFIGQEKILGRHSYLRRMIENDTIPSIVFYGPPGSGKTTLAKLIAETTGSVFVAINAVSSGIPELRKLINEARERQRIGTERTIIFIDEIHRFNKTQQDVLLPYVENGTITLLGATTENPFFEINTPLLSRMKVIRLERLTHHEIQEIIDNALADGENGYGMKKISISEDVRKIIAASANGDARMALNILEQAITMLPEDKAELNRETLSLVLESPLLQYDKKGENHYNVISAFIKSMRGSDADAALHYLARMLESGEDVKFIARRIVICAAEDVGNADPRALLIAAAAAQAAHFVGMPEAKIPLAQAVCYIANAPKSNSCYLGIAKAIEDVRNVELGTVPAHLRDNHYLGADRLGEGTGYLYPHDYPDGHVEQQYLPDNLKLARYYQPKPIGEEAILLTRNKYKKE